MNLSDKIRINLKEATNQDVFVVNDTDINTVVPKIKSTNPKATIKVVDSKKNASTTGMGSITNKDAGVTENEEKTDESYNIYAICTKSTGKTQGDEKWEKCVKDLKNKPGYKLGESVNPKMTKNELVEAVIEHERKIVKTVKVKDILKK